jgi:hypothetical protein
VKWGLLLLSLSFGCAAHLGPIDVIIGDGSITTCEGGVEIVSDGLEGGIVGIFKPVLDAVARALTKIFGG